MSKKIRFKIYLVIALLSLVFAREIHKSKESLNELKATMDRVGTKIDDFNELAEIMATKDDFNEIEERISVLEEEINDLSNEIEEQLEMTKEYLDFYFFTQGLMINLNMNASEFNDYIEYLKELRTLLPVSEQEEEMYPNTLSIGDPVLLDGELYESGYDLVHKENGRHAYYGNKEIRLINGVVLSYDGEVITVHTMKEVEEKMEEEYKVEGYSLINRFSGEDLTVEGNAKPNALTLMSF